MVQVLAVKAKEKSSFTIQFTFYSAVTGEAVTPTSVTWSLRTKSGDVVNNRNTISATPAETVTIVLNGDDLRLFSKDDNSHARRLTVEAIYDSSLGNDLNLRDEVEFHIDPLLGV